MDENKGCIKSLRFLSNFQRGLRERVKQSNKQPNGQIFMNYENSNLFWVAIGEGLIGYNFPVGSI